MGADGGICWIRVNNKEEFYRLTNFLHGEIRNEGALGYHYGSKYTPEEKDGWYLIDGGYGTDCSYDLRALVDLVRRITNGEYKDWEYEYILDCNIQDMCCILRFDSDYKNAQHDKREWWDHIQPVESALRYFLDDIVDSRSISECGTDLSIVYELTLRQWADQLSQIIDMSFSGSEETWT